MTRHPAGDEHCGATLLPGATQLAVGWFCYGCWLMRLYSYIIKVTSPKM